MVMSPESGSFQPEPIPLIPIIELEADKTALLSPALPTERGSGRWDIRRILFWGAIGAVWVPMGAYWLTKILGNDFFVPDTGSEWYIAGQVFFGGALGALSVIRRQQNQRKILASG